VLVGPVSDPRKWDRWAEAEALLEPARARGDFPSVLDDDEMLFAVIDGDELLAVATAWLSTERFVEVKLLGGRDYKRWLGELDKRLGPKHGGGSHAADRHWPFRLGQGA
jgi:hypothetical protein